MPLLRKLLVPLLLALVLVAIGVVLLMQDGSLSRSHRISGGELAVEHENGRASRDGGASQSATHEAHQAPRPSPYASTEADESETPRDLPLAPATLSVIVSDLSREPLVGARVTILRAPGAGDASKSQRPVSSSSVTDARSSSADASRVRADNFVAVGETGGDGRFVLSINALPHGSLRIVAEMPGYAADSVVWSRSDESAEVALRLRPGHAITGVVVDALGQALADARVEAIAGDALAVEADPLRAGRQRRGGVTGLVGSATTDGTGRFTLHVPNGSVSLIAHAAGYRSSTVPHVAAGTVSITIKLEPAAAIVGVVVDPGGAPVPGAEVFLHESRWADGEPFGFDDEEPMRTASTALLATVRASRRDVAAARCATVTNADGSFRFDGVDRTHVAMVVRAAGFVPTERAIELSNGETSRTVEIALSRAAVLRGTVKDPRGEPVPGALVAVEFADPASTLARTRDFGAVSIDLAHPISSDSMPATIAKAETDDQGRFTIDTLPPGELSLRVESKQHAPRLVPALSVDGEIEIEVELAGGYALRGRVLSLRDDEPIANATIRADCDGFARTAVTDGEGRYALEALASGRVDRVTIAAPGFEDGLFEQIDVTTGDVDFELDPEARIAGVVVSLGGAPVARARVAIVPAPPVLENALATPLDVDEDVDLDGDVAASATGVHASRPKTTSTDADGYFEIGGIQGGGRFKVVVDHAEYKRLVRDDVLVERGATVDNLERACSGAGFDVYVTDRRGAPVARAVVRVARRGETVAREIDGRAREIARDATRDRRSGPFDLSSAGSSSSQNDLEVNERDERSTGPDGRAVFRAMEAGTYRVRVEAVGFQVAYAETFASDESTGQVIVALETEHEIRGRVLDSAGLPIEGARITAVRETPAPLAAEFPAGRFGRGFGDGGRTRSGLEGEYRIGRLSPTTYRVTVEAPGFAREEIRDVRVDRDLDVALTPLGGIAGKVLDLDTGEPIAAFQLLVRGAKDDPSLYPLPSETPNRGRRVRRGGRDRVRGGEGARSGRDAAIPGVRIVREGARLSAGRGERSGRLANANDLRNGAGGRRADGGFSAGARANALTGEASLGASGAGEWHFFRNGEFRVADIEAGTWVIEVVARGYTGVNVEVNLDVGEVIDDIVIELPERVSIRGYVKAKSTSDRLPNATLYLLPLPEPVDGEIESRGRKSGIRDRLSDDDDWGDRDGRRSVIAETELALRFLHRARAEGIRLRGEEDGSFAFREVPEGDYMLLVEHPGYLPLSREVIVHEGVRAQYAMILDAGESLQGRVRLRRRRGAAITVVVESATGLSQRATTDRAGRYKIGGLLPGTYSVRMRMGSQTLVESLEVEIEEGKRNELDYRHEER